MSTLNQSLSDTQKMLSARFNDKIQIANRGDLVYTCFYTPTEAAFLSAHAKETGMTERFFLYGGYADAERCMAFFLPDFLSEYDGAPKDKAAQFFPNVISDAICALKVTGSGYRTLTHRDYLGSILSLGIERESVGDIVVINDHEAVIFCTDHIFEFLRANIDRIATDKVTVSSFIPDDTFEAKRDFSPINDTVASARFDCVVAALTNLAREKAQAAIKSGLCSLDHIEEIRCDREIQPPCTISVRGYGKYNVISIGGKTKRDRLRLYAKKYI